MDKRLITSRKVDDLGRIALGCEPGTIIDFLAAGDSFVILEKRKMSCTICDTTDGTFKECHNKLVCLDCVSALSNV